MSDTLTRQVGTLAIVLASLLLPAAARAHPQVDRGHQLLAQAEFEAALSAFDRAEASGQLTRGELLELLDGRVIAHLALGQKDRLEATLRTIAVVAPEHELPREATPEVRERLAALVAEGPGPIEVQVRTEVAPEGLAVEAEASDGGGVVRRVEAHARLADGAWREGRDRVVVPAAGGDTVEYWAEAIGPGGATVASRGSREQPLRTTREPAAPAGPAGPPGDDDEEGGAPWLWIGIGAAVAVLAIGVGVGVALAGDGGSDRTQPELPVVIGF